MKKNLIRVMMNLTMPILEGEIAEDNHLNLTEIIILFLIMAAQEQQGHLSIIVATTTVVEITII